MNYSEALHPGAILRSKFMEQHGLSASGLAIRLHVPAPRVNDIVRERRGISPDSALRLARFFGTTPQYWMDLQTAYDLKVAEEHAGEQIRREIPSPAQAAARTPAPVAPVLEREVALAA
ncbi:HigA family addiction module antitoxin [Aquabacterium sp.]|uniref:HigA family addiction module antitoxin n=1 Tax=Aquabacterium sp. TaxID=1872578 RepID=UPI0025C078D4|nr:HigA family addiction module antitoxin [Aquabacterium sp.]